MNFFKIILIFSLLVYACRQPVKSNALKPDSIALENIDLYPQYPSCPDYFEKDRQLECLMLKINNFMAHHLNNQYQKQFTGLKDTLWVKFDIDTLGQIHYLNIIHFKDRLQDSIYDDIFKKITYKIPKMKPAIYHDHPVNFEFKIPIINSNHQNQ